MVTKFVFILNFPAVLSQDDMIAKLLSIIANGVRNCLPGTLNNHHRILAAMDELLAVYQRPYEGATFLLLNLSHMVFSMAL